MKKCTLPLFISLMVICDFSKGQQIPAAYDGAFLALNHNNDGDNITYFGRNYLVNGTHYSVDALWILNGAKIGSCTRYNGNVYGVQQEGPHAGKMFRFYWDGNDFNVVGYFPTGLPISVSGNPVYYYGGGLVPNSFNMWVASWVPGLQQSAIQTVNLNQNGLSPYSSGSRIVLNFSNVGGIAKRPGDIDFLANGTMIGIFDDLGVCEINLSTGLVTLLSPVGLYQGYRFGSLGVFANIIHAVGNPTEDPNGYNAKCLYDINQTNWTLAIRGIPLSLSHAIVDGTGNLNANSFLGLVVPVTWASFTASIKGTVVDLLWKTATEQNNKGFEVEQSLDGINFTKIGFVSGKNSAAGASYNFDKSLSESGTYFYRLRQIDFDGKASYSQIVKIVYKETVSVSIYPNPVTNHLFIKSNEKIAAVTLYDGAGKTLRQIKHSSYTIKLDVSNLPKGTYTLMVNGESKTFIK